MCVTLYLFKPCQRFNQSVHLTNTELELYIFKKAQLSA